MIHGELLYQLRRFVARGVIDHQNFPNLLIGNFLRGEMPKSFREPLGAVVAAEDDRNRRSGSYLRPGEVVSTALLLTNKGIPAGGCQPVRSSPRIRLLTLTLHQHA